MKPLRTFIAVPLPDAVRVYLGGLVREMSAVWPRNAVRWVDADSMHLTLRFLGPTDPAQVTGLRSGLRELGACHAPFHLHLAASGCFPNARNPRVIWVDLVDSGRSLAELQGRVEHLARSCGWQRERRPFKPHLTLGRVRERGVPPAARWLCDVQPLAVLVDRVELLSSRLQPHGAEYSTLEAVPLSEQGAGRPPPALPSTVG